MEDYSSQQSTLKQWLQAATEKGRRQGYDAGFADGKKTGHLEGIGTGYLDGLARRREQLKELDTRLRNAGRSTLADTIQDEQHELDNLIKQYGLD